MTVQLRPEDELRLVANKKIINAEIEAGLAKLDRGEGSTEPEVRAWMAEQKQIWRANRGR
jgi:predicted transcriptional regulator